MELKTERGYDFYEVASALQKSIRRGDIKIAGFMALELFPRYAEYCWKRLLTISAEDCDGLVTKEIKALYDSFHVINSQKGKPLKGRIFISKAVIILCKTRHNRDADLLQNYVYDKMALISEDQIESYFEEVRKENVNMPEYIYDVHTVKGKRAGKTKNDFFIQEQKALSNPTESELYHQLTIFDYIKE